MRLMTHGAFLLVAGSLFAACSFGPSRSDTPASVVASLRRGPSPTSVVLTLRNDGDSPVSVCPCVGPHQRFAVVEVRDAATGQVVPHPEILFAVRKLDRLYSCLDPGESLDLPIDLSAWRPRWGSQEQAEPVHDFLSRPGEYLVRAWYTDRPGVRVRRCGPFIGSIVSPTLEMSIPVGAKFAAAPGACGQRLSQAEVIERLDRQLTATSGVYLSIAIGHEVSVRPAGCGYTVLALPLDWRAPHLSCLLTEEGDIIFCG